MKHRLKSQLGSLGTLLFTNPVVVRDLRAQMRGTKSYWFQGAFLLLLGTLAIAGYAQATQQQFANPGDMLGRSVNIVDAQGHLQQLYSFIFGTIAIMICVIAPALTAASIVGERQRLSFDLLVTTPLRASELLVGKLVSSIAFLGLLLMLSLPASALCILFGGATLGDVFRVYVMLIVDGLVLAAIGLFFSCASKNNLLAIVWSYVSVGAFLGVTESASLMSSPAGAARIGDSAHMLLSLAVLNPMVAITPSAQQGISVGIFSIPLWIVSLVPAILLIRLLVTASTYRLGAYGRASGPSLRRQALLLCGLVAFLVSNALVTIDEQFVTTSWVSSLSTTVILAMIVAFLSTVAFLPGLFVPVASEDGPIPARGSGDRTNRSGYRIARAFYPEHSGALPYYHLTALVTVLAGTLPIMMSKGAPALLEAVPSFILGLVYISALGYLNLQIARFAAHVAEGASGARALTFGLFALLCVLPVMALGLSGVGHWGDSWIAHLDVLYPLFRTEHLQATPMDFFAAVAESTAVCYVIGAAFLPLNRRMSARRSRAVAAGPRQGAAA